MQVLQPRCCLAIYRKDIEYVLSKHSTSRVLEIGTYTDIAPCVLQKAFEMVKSSIDSNKELELFTRTYFSKSKFNDKIEFIVSNALNVIPQLEETWDLIFLRCGQGKLFKL